MRLDSVLHTRSAVGHLSRRTQSAQLRMLFTGTKKNLEPTKVFAPALAFAASDCSSAGTWNETMRDCL